MPNTLLRTLGLVAAVAAVASCSSRPAAPAPGPVSSSPAASAPAAQWHAAAELTARMPAAAFHLSAVSTAAEVPTARVEADVDPSGCHVRMRVVKYLSAATGDDTVRAVRGYAVADVTVDGTRADMRYAQVPVAVAAPPQLDLPALGVSSRAQLPAPGARAKSVRGDAIEVLRRVDPGLLPTLLPYLPLQRICALPATFAAAVGPTGPVAADWPGDAELAAADRAAARQRWVGAGQADTIAGLERDWVAGVRAAQHRPVAAGDVAPPLDMTPVLAQTRVEFVVDPQGHVTEVTGRSVPGQRQIVDVLRFGSPASR